MTTPPPVTTPMTTKTTIDSVPKVGETARITIDKLAIGGRGVGRFEGMVVFVSDVAPGELVDVEFTLVKKNFSEARLIEVVTASAARVVPQCPVFGLCGGCTWQHVSYAEQLRQKHGFVLDAFRKFSKFEIADDLIEPVVPSPQEWRYRNRIQLHHRSDAGKVTVGFHQRGSHDIVDILDCPITEKILTDQLPSMHKTFRDQTPGRYEIYIAEDGEIHSRSTFSDTQTGDSYDQSSNKKPVKVAAKPSRRPFRDVPTRGGPPAKAANKSKPAAIHEPAAPPFAQVNTAQNEQLVGHCMAIFRELADPYTKTVYDLYAGHGNFTFPLAGLFSRARIEAVELNPQSVLTGNQEAKLNGLGGRVLFTANDVAHFLSRGRTMPNGKTAAAESLDDSVVLLDPPRTGCAPEVMKALAEAKPSLIVYVSCHPVTLARDLGVFNEASAHGYDLLEVTPFDMFPQTDHVESVAVLRRKSEPEKL